MDPELQKLEQKLPKESFSQKKLSEIQNEEKNGFIQKAEKDVIDELLEYKDQTNYGKSELKLKNERLIKLAEENFELGVFEKPIYKKSHETNETQKNINQTFKKRKTNTCKALLINPDESP